MSGRGWWGLLLAMVLVGGFSQWRFFSSVEENSIAQAASIPHEIGPWRGVDVSLDERTYEILETRNVLYREYKTAPENPSVELCIVFSRANRKAPHPPEVCYTGSGANVEQRPLETVNFSGEGAFSSPLRGNTLSVVHGQTRELVLYWYLAGTKLTTSYYDQQLKILWAQLTGRPAQSALIRYSTVIQNETPEQAMAHLKEFAQVSLPTILDQLIQH